MFTSSVGNRINISLFGVDENRFDSTIVHGKSLTIAYLGLQNNADN